MSPFYEGYDEIVEENNHNEYIKRGLQLDFDFKNGSGNTVTDKVNNKTGNLGSGDITWSNEGLVFGGTGYSTVTIENTTTGEYQPVSEFTLEAYVKLKGDTTFGNVIGRASLYHFALSINNGIPSIMLYDNYCNSMTTLGKEGFYHIVGTYSKANGLKLYINGILDKTLTLAKVDVPSTALDGKLYDFTIGGQDIVQHYFNGTISTARYYNVELSEEEIMINYKNV